MAVDYSKSPMVYAAEHASRVLLQNKECFIAAFFRAHPEVDPVHVRLCSRNSVDGKRVFWIEVHKPKRTPNES